MSAWEVSDVGAGADLAGSGPPPQSADLALPP